MDCFDKTRRLLKKCDYDRVFAQAKKLATPEFIVLHHISALGDARLGLVISKRMLPKAHDRNRIKRLIRETFRTTRLPAVDVVFLARHGLAGKENKTIIAGLGKIWDKLIALYAA